MDSSEHKPSEKCNNGNEDYEKTEGTYIEERKRNVEYLDLQTESSVISQSKDPIDEDDNTSTSKTKEELNQNEQDLPPGEDKNDSTSFDNEFSDMYTEKEKGSTSSLKRTIAEANLENPENQYLTLDELEEIKKAKLEGTKESPKVSSQPSTSIR